MGDGEISATGREALYSETEREKIHTLIKRYCGSGKRAEFTRPERFGKGELGELVFQGKNMEQVSANPETSPKTSQAARAPPAITRSRKGKEQAPQQPCGKAQGTPRGDASLAFPTALPRTNWAPVGDGCPRCLLQHLQLWKSVPGCFPNCHD